MIAKQIRIRREWIILTDGDRASSAEIELAALMKGVVLRLRKIVDMRSPAISSINDFELSHGRLLAYYNEHPFFRPSATKSNQQLVLLTYDNS